MSLQPNGEPRGNYGHFPGPLAHTYNDSELQFRLDSIGRLVEDYWGNLGQTILLAFRKVLQQTTGPGEYIVEEVAYNLQGNLKYILERQ
jgi:hypothetical protein